ncbi:MAG: GTP-binding protein [Oculatellaceae cyanobacterium Prado106]|jgi:G3E family GTPase|nr:GTP-binding protein [Oculatellaceae cyanobacterium Prado106]
MTATTANASPTPLTPKIPATILTGYLGAGKTTLLNHILTQNHGKRIAVIINEFGEVGIDQQLVQADEAIIAMKNGSICCTVRKEMIRMIGDLMAQSHTFDHLIIETTGLADPAPVVQTFFVDETMRDRTQLEAVVTVIDTLHVTQHWEAKEVQEQILFADVILLNKIDLVSPQQLAKLEQQIQAMNPAAKIYPTERSQISLDAILNISAFNLDRALSLDNQFLQKHVHEHDKTIGSVSLSEPGKIDTLQLQNWLNALVQTQRDDIFRIKGIFTPATGQRQVLQGMHSMLNWTAIAPETPLSTDNDGSSDCNELVLIGRNLDESELRENLRKCLIRPGK